MTDFSEKRGTQAPRRVMIAAGGTGGHVMPGLAVALALKKQGVEVVWLGTRKGIESRLVPEAGFSLFCIDIFGIRGKGWHIWLKAPWAIMKAVGQACWVLYRQKPERLLSMGGYVSGPAGVAAWLLRCPLLLHEQNAIPGWTNRRLSRFADQILVSFPSALRYFPKEKVIETGNPLREAIVRIPPPETRFRHTRGALRVLVLGGSQGAQILNQWVPEAVAGFSESDRPWVWHQAGFSLLKETKEAYRSYSRARVVAFIEAMEEAYAWADVVICRSGALTVSEVMAVGIPAVFVPFPGAVDDHQTSNARYFADQGAAYVLPQKEGTPMVLQAFLREWMHFPKKRLQMAIKARSLAKPWATQHVSQYCLAKRSKRRAYAWD